ncbi:MAG TPA: lysine--tRNA ligase, partial [Candidatus Methylomirabilis sp.]|nr:lysine--tRNA ligase [Candidatus Methylomirabilis sp.]
LRALRDAGVNPYPSVAERTASCADSHASFDQWSADGTPVTIAGRVMITRIHGAMIFADVRDASGQFQIQLTQDRQGDKSFELFRDRIDPGDFVQATGTLFKTKRGENTLAVTDWILLAKALRPLPEKFHGLKDVELRYRDRELDLVANEDTRAVFRLRSKTIRALREFLDAEGFDEVETPVLQAIPGGATARPFVTHHNALDHDFYLRIAPELYLKRCVVGGYEKVYELGRQFRNEGIDWSHNPEFTSLEFYWAYQDYRNLMEFTERYLTAVIARVLGTTTIRFDGNEINFMPPWPRETFRDAVKTRSGVDIAGMDRDTLVRAMQGLKIDCDYAKADLGKLYDELYKETVRKTQIQPLFVHDYPIEMEPLAKKCDDDPRFVQRFQLLAGGLELLKAFSELNDPIDQLERFRAQNELREAGDEEAQRIDMAFVRALEHGLPPTAGWGMGVDRFVMMLADRKSIKDVILFPTLRPEGENDERGTSHD